MPKLISDKDLVMNSEIQRIRNLFKNLKIAGLRDGWIKSEYDLHFAHHLAQRIVERRLQGDVTFILGLTKYFMAKIFYETTYNERVYTLQLRGLKVGIRVSKGVITEQRHAIISTAFTNEFEYECDEVINLK